ncbi:restriction endonuclease [Streptomyces sp. NPDC097617]|uniref:nSTAND3 domain-containing NTPase n=1 Tax=Streptomyces sp. NPDC097617 TaxID=3366091 RepID=UPI0037F80F86
MDSFDVGRLTDHDFEVVCRDLFGDMLGVPLEIFPRGRDHGIDLRHVANDGTTTIVQCKHWPRGSQAQLTRHLIKHELPKVIGLKPDRYVIATSVGLTVDGKEKLRAAFHPYIRGAGDIHGLESIVAELGSRPELVRRHFRLWLSSTAILRTVLHQGKHLQSSWLRRRLIRSAESFVPHEGFERAKEVLSEQRVCVIAGVPGVGKTTNALMLACWLMDQGYELHEVSSDIKEITDLWDETVPQVFLYDDFLGQTTLESSLNKNEDSRILSVIDEIQRSPLKALIMTTRDYILEHARLRHDRLTYPEIASATTVVCLNDLSLGVRGEILYNHVRRSSLSSDQKARFADPAAWRPIVQHNNFNPRLIEETLRLAPRAKGGGDAVNTMMENLTDPRRVWERIVENEVPDEGVHLLEVLFTFQSAELNTLEESWSRYRRALGAAADGRTFRKALQLLEGTMLRLDDGAVYPHNPSINDYMRYHLHADRVRIRELLAACVEPRQVYSLVAAAEMADGIGILAQLKAHPQCLVDAVRNTIDRVDTSLSEEDESRASHLEWVLETAEMLGSIPLATFTLEATEYYLTPYEHHSHMVSLSNALSGSTLVSGDRVKQFRDRVSEGIRTDLMYPEEDADAFMLVELHSLLEELSAGLPTSDAREQLMRGALEDLRNLVTHDESGDNPYYIDRMRELLRFIGDEESERPEIAAASIAVARFDDARRAAEKPAAPPLEVDIRWLLQPGFGRDDALVTELLGRLGSPEEPDA